MANIQEQHEKKVEKFYSTGLHRHNLDENWELTFGYWKNRNSTYMEAAMNMWSELFNKLAITSDSIIVSVAPGMGKELIFLYEQYKPKKIIGIDITKQHVDRANRLIEACNLQDKISVIHGSGIELNKYFSASFATHVICVEGTSQMIDREKFFSSAYSILQPHGMIGICDATAKSLSKFSFFILKFVCKLWKVPSSNIITGDQVKSQLEKVHFIADWVDITKFVWNPYCREKRRVFFADIKRRGLLSGIAFLLINEAIHFADAVGIAGYGIFVGRKPH